MYKNSTFLWCQKDYCFPLWLKEFAFFDYKFELCMSKSYLGTLPEVWKQGEDKEIDRLDWQSKKNSYVCIYIYTHVCVKKE